MNAIQTVPDSATGAPVTQSADAARHPRGHGDRYVVGVDGSAQSMDALRWAARTAHGPAARMEALTTWEQRVGMAGPYIAGADRTYPRAEDDARALLTGTVEDVCGRDRPPNVTLRLRQGDAAHILVEESKTAQLLVIGSRGLGEVAGLLLGSVSAHCAEKAHCPVLIMHAAESR